jgi:hypothetical protein
MAIEVSMEYLALSITKAPDVLEPHKPIGIGLERLFG